MTRLRPHAALLVAFASPVCALSCDPERPPLRRRYILPPEVDAAAPDVTAPDRLCALRATPSEDLAIGPGRARAAVAWSGAHYGIAWRQTELDDVFIGFVRVGANGERIGQPARVTERGFTPGAPNVVWNGASWSILFDGGFGAARGDVYQARVDVRGNAVGTPWRMTRGSRDDVEPAIASRAAVGARSDGGAAQPAEGFGLTWIAREEYGHRNVLYGQLLNRWDAPTSFALRLLDTTATLASPKLTWTGTQWAFTCLSSRSEVLAVDFVRLDDKGRLTGSLQHVSPDRIGGVEVESRYDIAYSGGGFGVVWSELRDGTTQVFYRRVSARGNPLGGDVRVSEGAPSATEPAIVGVADGVFAVAMRVERDGLSRVWVRTVDAGGTFQRGYVELQGADGLAGTPAVVHDGAGVGVVTVSRRAVAFHRVTMGPCVAP